MPLMNSLWRDTVGELQLREAATASPTTPIRDVVSLMQRKRAGCCLILEGDRLAGIFTERDLLKRVIGKKAPAGSPVSTVMTKSPSTVEKGDVVATAIQKMREGGYRNLPVVEGPGRVVGWISVPEIVRWMVEHFPKVVYNLPPQPDQMQTAREGA